MPETAHRQGRIDTGAARFGQLVEEWFREQRGLDLVDWRHYDATDSTGTFIQIKGCQRWHSNGPDERATGRFRVWENPLVHSLADAGMYLFAIYDPDADPTGEGFIENYRYMSPEDVGELAKGKWYDGHRSSKGRTARLRWDVIFDG